MQIVYAKEAAPIRCSKSIFLVGPTPRSQDVPSWRPDAIRALEAHGYDGVVFVPEAKDNWSADYLDQIEWERTHLEMADVILAWVPRDLDTMPAFTTNVEFGRYITSGKLIYGRPEESPKNRYLDWMYTDVTKRQPCTSLMEITAEVIDRLGEGAIRCGGERNVPLHIWQTPMFKDWYSQLSYTNMLADARLLWQFLVPNTQNLFSYVLWVKIWVGEEERYKEIEYIFSRPDTSVVLPYWIDGDDLLATKIVLIREYRVPVRNSTGYVHELPGGSTFKDSNDPKELASFELKEETGIDISAERFKLVQSRQVASTLTTHKAVLFTVALSDEEIKVAEDAVACRAEFGVTEDTERTFLEVRTLRDILLTNDVDWSMIGMMANGITEHFGHHQNGLGKSSIQQNEG